MNSDIFAEWLRRQGHQVVRTESSYWYDAGTRVFQAFPYHWIIEPTREELLILFRRKRAIALRYSTSLDSPTGCISYHAIYDEPTYTLDGLDRRSRQNIRKGLKNCHVEPISFERMAEEGWLLETDTASRQGRSLMISRRSWLRRYLAAADLPGFEAWGALVDGRLVASLVTCQIDDWCEMISQQCHSDYLSARINNALAFVVTQTMINRSGIRSVFYTLQGLDGPPSLDQFKFRMGYKAKSVRQHVVFHPLLAPFINKGSRWVVKQMLKKSPHSSFLSKMEGLLRFHLEGKCPATEQKWPECLGHRKTELCEEFDLL